MEIAKYNLLTIKHDSEFFKRVTTDDKSFVYG